MKRPASGYKSISRIDQPERHNHGWYVRVYFASQKRVAFFADARHGGREAALSHAVRFRDRSEREMGKPRTDRAVMAPRARRSTGIVGVERSGDYYIVHSTPEPGRMRRQFVRIRPGHEASAFRKACRMRRQEEVAMWGAPNRRNWSVSLSRLVEAADSATSINRARAGAEKAKGVSRG